MLQKSCQTPLLLAHPLDHGTAEHMDAAGLHQLRFWYQDQGPAFCLEDQWLHGKKTIKIMLIITI